MQAEGSCLYACTHGWATVIARRPTVIEQPNRRRSFSPSPPPPPATTLCTCLHLRTGYYSGAKVDELVGADPAKLEALVQRCAASTRTHALTHARSGCAAPRAPCSPPCHASGATGGTCRALHSTLYARMQPRMQPRMPRGVCPSSAHTSMLAARRLRWQDPPTERRGTHAPLPACPPAIRHACSLSGKATALGAGQKLGGASTSAAAPAAGDDSAEARRARMAAAAEARFGKN